MQMYAPLCDILWIMCVWLWRETSIWFYLSSVGTGKVKQKYSIWSMGCNCQKIHSTQWWVIKQMKQDPSAACTIVVTWPTSVEWRNADSYLMEDMARGQDKSSWNTNFTVIFSFTVFSSTTGTSVGDHKCATLTDARPNSLIHTF